MKKNIIMFIVLILSIIILIFGYYKWNDYYDTSYDTEDFTIENEEYLIRNSKTALTIGSAILKEIMPRSYEDVKKQLVATLEEDDIWYVRNKQTKRDIAHYTKGGGIYVKIYAKNGEIIKVGVND